MKADSNGESVVIGDLRFIGRMMYSVVRSLRLLQRIKAEGVAVAEDAVKTKRMVDVQAEAKVAVETDAKVLRDSYEACRGR